MRLFVVVFVPFCFRAYFVALNVFAKMSFLVMLILICLLSWCCDGFYFLPLCLRAFSLVSDSYSVFLLSPTKAFWYEVNEDSAFVKPESEEGSRYKVIDFSPP